MRSKRFWCDFFKSYFESINEICGAYDPLWQYVTIIHKPSCKYCIHYKEREK